jgi:hypothetical protein
MCYKTFFRRDWGKQQKSIHRDNRPRLVPVDFRIRNTKSTRTRTVLWLLYCSLLHCLRKGLSSSCTKHETSRELTWLVANVRSVFYHQNTTCSPRVYAHCTDATKEEVVMKWSVTHSGSFTAGKSCGYSLIRRLVGPRRRSTRVWRNICKQSWPLKTGVIGFPKRR